MGYKPTGPLFCLRALAALAQWTLLWINALNAFLICQILFIHKQEIYNGSGDRSGKPASTRCALRWVSTAHGFLVQRRRQQNSLRDIARRPQVDAWVHWTNQRRGPALADP